MDKEQGTQREHALELLGSGEAVECEQTAELTWSIVPLAVEYEAFFRKIVALAIQVNCNMNRIACASRCAVSWIGSDK